MKNILFITWDGPQTSYMEGLFLPIFHEIVKTQNIKFHVIQFTWAEEAKTAEVQRVASSLGIQYTAFPVLKKPLASFGSIYTLLTASNKIKKYIDQHSIDVVMPRSTFPACMVNRLTRKDFKLIFDADGLPIDERVEYAGLKKDGLQYQWLKSIESNMLHKADAVLTRSKKAIDIHTQILGEECRSKFSVVKNGKNISEFRVDFQVRIDKRKDLGLKDEFLFLYAGSLGPQYCLPEMLNIFENYSQKHESKFLILSGNLDYAKKHIPEHIKPQIILKSVNHEEIPKYLNAADFGFGLRQPSFSMQGVSPIKIGEYLLCGLPLIASKNIGDTAETLREFEACYLFDHQYSLLEEMPKMMKFIENSKNLQRTQIHQQAKPIFSLEAAVESYQKAFQKIL